MNPMQADKSVLSKKVTTTGRRSSVDRKHLNKKNLKNFRYHQRCAQLKRRINLKMKPLIGVALLFILWISMDIAPGCANMCTEPQLSAFTHLTVLGIFSQAVFLLFLFTHNRYLGFFYLISLNFWAITIVVRSSSKHCHHGFLIGSSKRCLIEYKWTLLVSLLAVNTVCIFQIYDLYQLEALKIESNSSVRQRSRQVTESAANSTPVVVANKPKRRPKLVKK